MAASRLIASRTWSRRSRIRGSGESGCHRYAGGPGQAGLALQERDAAIENGAGCGGLGEMVHAAGGQRNLRQHGEAAGWRIGSLVLCRRWVQPSRDSTVTMKMARFPPGKSAQSRLAGIIRSTHSHGAGMNRGPDRNDYRMHNAAPSDPSRRRVYPDQRMASCGTVPPSWEGLLTRPIGRTARVPAIGPGRAPLPRRTSRNKRRHAPTLTADRVSDRSARATQDPLQPRDIRVPPRP